MEPESLITRSRSGHSLEIHCHMWTLSCISRKKKNSKTIQCRQSKELSRLHKQPTSQQIDVTQSEWSLQSEAENRRAKDHPSKAALVITIAVCQAALTVLDAWMTRLDCIMEATHNHRQGGRMLYNCCGHDIQKVRHGKELSVSSLNKNAIMFTLYYATQYIFQSLKLMVFQLEWPHLQITILLLQMNSTPRWGVKSTAGNASRFHTALLSYHTHAHVHVREHTRGSRRSCLSTWMSGSLKTRGNDGERLSIWGGVSHSLLGQTDTFYYSLSLLVCAVFDWIRYGDCKASSVTTIFSK